jgi:hypothetical protein
MDHRSLDPALGARPQVITVRAILLGLVTVAFMTFLVNYQAHVSLAASLNLSQFSAAAQIMFILWVIINSVWRLAAPRRALTTAELLTILAMVWASGNLNGRAWTGRLVAMLAAPKYLATNENRWAEIYQGLGRDSLLPLWLFPDFSTNAVEGFYTALPPEAAIPWSSWASPIFWWCAAMVAFMAFAISTTAIFYRQWADNERLAFPLLQAPMALVEQVPGQRFPPIFKKRLFWVGILLTGGVLCWNIGGYFEPSWPTTTIYAPAAVNSRVVVTGFPAISFRTMPLVLGFLYFANLDLLLSLWVFFILGWIVSGISNTTGFAVGSGALKVSGIDIVHLHSFGALVFLFLWSVWIARRHLRHVLRSALSRNRAADNPGGMLRYRTALITCLWALVYLIAFCREIGMTWGVIGLALGFNVIAFFTVAKYMAATGLGYINPPYSAAGRLIVNMAGDAWMTPKSIIGLGLLHGGYFGQMQRLWGFGMTPHAFKISERADHGRRRILVAIVLAVLLAAGLGLYNILYLGYARGGLRMEGYTFQNAPNDDFGFIMKCVSDVQRGKGLPADTEKLTVWSMGFLLCAVITVCHVRFTWWPLHPVGMAFSSTSAGNYWFSILMVWLFKLILLKIGGVKLYERFKPVFVGFIAGYILALIISFSVDAIFFYGQEGHGIHNW